MSNRKPPRKSKDDQTWNKRVTVSESSDIVCDYLEQLDTPRALAVWMMYKHGSHRDLVSLAYNPNSCYVDPWDIPGSVDRCRRDYAATKFLSKCKTLKTGINTKEVAIASAREAEFRNQTTNAIFECAEEGREASFIDTQQPVMATLNPLIMRAQEIVARILGPLTPGMFKDPGFSSGRTSSAFGTEKTIMHKYMSRLDITPRALHVALPFVQSSPVWGAAALSADGPSTVTARAFTLVPGNTLTVVPKNAKTDRVICYEPHVNIRLQLAVGAYLKQRLACNGINLFDQSVNQRRAKLSSKLNHLATLDLASASDTISIGLVRALLPVEWFDLLDALRSPYTLWPDGTQKLNHKFSSMGNGFTFELESLLFYALASCGSPNVSVYGDDIICARPDAPAVVRNLTMCGLSINSQKSFIEGPFRESCGCDALLGYEITPFYLRAVPNSRYQVVRMHNGVRKFASASFATRSWAEMLRSWRMKHSYHLGPAAHADGEPLGDGHYHVNFEEACPNRAPFGLDGWWYKTTDSIYRVNRYYGDRVAGRFSGVYSFAALCVALGPKHAKSVFDVSVDRREVSLRTKRKLASFVWPSVMWV